MHMPQRTSLRLALSGGGFRASYFHLGALYALGQQGKLVDLDVMTTVSGGSIAAAMYLLELGDNTGPIDAVKTMDAAAKALGALVSRTRVSPRHKAIGSVRSVSRALAYEEFGTSMAMERQYAAWFRQHSFPRDSPWLPEWRIATSDSLSGQRTLLVFNDRGMPRTEAGYIPIHKYQIARAVSASTAVPGIFEPVSWSGSDGTAYRLSDGGILDNQGIRELRALCDGRATCICIDASARLNWLPSISGWGTVGRAMDMLMEQTRGDSMHDDIDLRTLRQTDGPVRPEWWQKLMDLRTDLDDFSLVEVYLLFLAGYQSIAGAAIPPQHRELEAAQGLWKLVMQQESGPAAANDALYAEVLDTLGRGKYVLAAGIRAPNVVSVVITFVSAYMGFVFALGILTYLLLISALSERVIQPYGIDGWLAGSLPWMAATSGFVGYHMSGHRKLPPGAGAWAVLWRVGRIASSPLLLPPLLLFAWTVRCLAHFSERSAGDRALLKRIGQAMK